MRLYGDKLFTGITETVDFNLIEGLESLVYYVRNIDCETESIELGCKKFSNRNDAYDYAHWLNEKFNTSDIVEL